jgi:tetratricopeptide (TPR) repeat protein
MESHERTASSFFAGKRVCRLGQLGLAICLVAWSAESLEANQSSKEWAEWRQDGNTLVSSGDYAGAAQAFRQALALSQSGNLNDSTVVGLYQALAWAYSQEGEFAEAECEYRKAMALVEKDKGTHSLDYALLLASFSLLPTRPVGTAEAIQTLREALSFNEQSGSPADLALVRDGLAKILCREKRWEEAEKLLLESKAYYSSHASEDPEVVAELLNDLGVLRSNQRRYVEAGELHYQSIRILETMCGNDHPTLIVPLNNLATIYIRIGRYEDAERDFQQALSICRKSLGEEHPIYGDVLGNYAALLRKLGRKREAKKAEEQSQRILQASNRHNGVGFKVSASALRSEGG